MYSTGKLWLQDALTDLSAHPEEVTIVDELTGAKAHKGIWHAARYVSRILQEGRLIERAFERAPVSLTLALKCPTTYFGST